MEKTMAGKGKGFDIQNIGFLQNIILRVRLILRLMGDRRISIFLKILLVAALIYVISPVDFLPGLILPVVGALDDAAVIWLGTTLFVSLCPEEVVREHTDALEKIIPGSWREAVKRHQEDEVVDAESQDVVNEKPGELPG
jgi:uncharacterized membrane protein YkvA (DUF1232 family)